MSWNLEETVAYYRRQGAPGDQSVSISLLKEIQQECGGSIPAHIPAYLAESYGIKESYFLALIRRIPSLRLGETKTLELCAGPNCGKHTQLAAFAEKLCKEKGITLKFLPCQRQCAKGPNVRWNGKLYNRMNEETIRSILENL